ncbi:hypothetical protein [Burkholderia thailandensis]|uniref:hypothetical protein n=1 Tax=Burkholderia thailandensis TaxID=57975 RepID=UPI0003EC724E|nr:hypothetical protein [Burkholderia thailandensis]AHI65462.1 hypothetical protein BTL_1528 [Burkholderia thailandensis H0587]AVR25890.1 hypothetical protein A8H32_12965 [Burkholderia thailandensis]MCZ2895205.1 hypothetical protein [Burkholderia thailandensis]TGB31383.1 hypothetical protein C6946_23405 [Burkholderia thailandensis]
MKIDAIYERIAAVADAPLHDDPNPVIMLARVVDVLMRDDTSDEARSALEFVVAHVIRACWWAAQHDASLGLGGIYEAPSVLLAQFRRELTDVARVREIMRVPPASTDGGGK